MNAFLNYNQKIKQPKHKTQKLKPIEAAVPKVLAMGIPSFEISLEVSGFISENEIMCLKEEIIDFESLRKKLLDKIDIDKEINRFELKTSNMLINLLLILNKVSTRKIFIQYINLLNLECESYLKELILKVLKNNFIFLNEETVKSPAISNKKIIFNIKYHNKILNKLVLDNDEDNNDSSNLLFKDEKEKTEENQENSNFMFDISNLDLTYFNYLILDLNDILSFDFSNHNKTKTQLKISSDEDNNPFTANYLFINFFKSFINFLKKIIVNNPKIQMTVFYPNIATYFTKFKEIINELNLLINDIVFLTSIYIFEKKEVFSLFYGLNELNNYGCTSEFADFSTSSILTKKNEQFLINFFQKHIKNNSKRRTALFMSDLTKIDVLNYNKQGTHETFDINFLDKVNHNNYYKIEEQKRKALINYEFLKQLFFLVY